jgi:hypothetical protein
VSAASSVITDPSAQPLTARKPALNASAPANAPPATVPNTLVNANANQNLLVVCATAALKAIQAGRIVSHAPVTALVARTTPALPHAAASSVTLAHTVTSASMAILVSQIVPSAVVAKVAPA